MPKQLMTTKRLFRLSFRRKMMKDGTAIIMISTKTFMTPNAIQIPDLYTLAMFS